MLLSKVCRGILPKWIKFELDLNLPKKRPESTNLTPRILDLAKDKSDK